MPNDIKPRWANRIALVATLLLPLFLMYGRAIAEMLIAVADLAFLWTCWRDRSWRWLRARWVIVGGLWWAWLILCSLPGIGAGGVPSLLQALAVGRYLLFVAALEHQVLRDAMPRIWLGRVLAACAVWIGLNSWLQFATGQNVAGLGRWMDGELTGPFEKPRAGAPLSRLIFPAMLPAIRRSRLLAAISAIAAVGTIVLIGQRMPLLLTLLVLVVSALLLRRLRTIMILTIAAGAILLASTAVISPPSFRRLVTKFSDQMEHFGESPYGLLAGRALVMAEAHPLLGRGFFGFRTGCNNPEYAHGFAWEGKYAADGGGPDGCNIHPHNHYLEALTDAGIPGLVLFSTLMVLWLGGMLRRLGPDPDPARVGLFVAAFIHEWPLASASSFFAMDTGGWLVVFVGAGLAYARAASKTAAMSPELSIPST